ncbi:MAG TPA: phosphoribosyltransferase family protein [Mycobacteriales bacterium]|nr:phosphoribosyltransferase family protein [Mycobacteriales bacterium]
MDADEILRRSAARRGHFAFESGYHGRLWLDLDLLLSEPARIAPVVRVLARLLRPDRPEIVCGPMSGGALVAYRVAEQLGCGFAYADRVPDTTYRIPPVMRRHCAGRRVAIVDDVVNAGSAVMATARELPDAVICAIGALLVLGDGPDVTVPLRSPARIANELWRPEHCPDCAAGLALEKTTP